jgi:hypothetical protein
VSSHPTEPTEFMCTKENMADFNARYTQANVPENAAIYDRPKFVEWRNRLVDVKYDDDVSTGILVELTATICSVSQFNNPLRLQFASHNVAATLWVPFARTSQKGNPTTR